MRLKDRLIKIKEEIANEENAAFENLKNTIFESVNQNAEAWIREGKKRIIVYPEVGEDPVNHNIKDFMENVNVMEVLTEKERHLYGHLVEEEGVGVTSYQYSGITYITIEL